MLARAGFAGKEHPLAVRLREAGAQGRLAGERAGIAGHAGLAAPGGGRRGAQATTHVGAEGRRQSLFCEINHRLESGGLHLKRPAPAEMPDRRIAPERAHLECIGIAGEEVAFGVAQRVGGTLPG